MERCDEVFGLGLMDRVRVDPEQDGEDGVRGRGLSMRSTTKRCIRS